MKRAMRHELSRAADADIVGILDYGAANFGWDRAEAYVAGFDNSFALLTQYPEIGAVHDDIRPPIRSLPYGSHRIYYDIEGDVILVRRILHMSRDAKLWLE
jgi:toxin ParE1/3/4